MDRLLDGSLLRLGLILMSGLLQIAAATDCYRYTEYVHIYIGVAY